MPPTPYLAKPDNIKVNLLVYGKAGSGKTTLACTAQDHPDLSPVLLLNFEGGTLSIAGRGDINTVDIKSMHELQQMYDVLWSNDPAYAVFKTIIIDSGSEMLALAQREATYASVQAGKWGKDRTIDDIVMQDYGLSGARMKRLLSGFRDLPRHTIITALPRFMYPQGVNGMPGSTPIEVAPNFPNSLREPVMGFMDFVWYSYASIDPNTGLDNRNILTRDHQAYRAKTRGQFFAQALGQLVVNTTLPVLYELLKRSENPETRAAVFASMQAPVSVDTVPEPVPDADSAISIGGGDVPMTEGAPDEELAVSV